MGGPAQFRRAGPAAARHHVLRGRPGDDGRIRGSRFDDHRDRRGQGPRRRGARRVPDPGQPARGRSRRSSPSSPASPTRWSATRRPSSRRCPRSWSSPQAACWWPTTRRSTSASSALRQPRRTTPGRGFEVLDTAKLARRVITRDDAPNCKLSSLAQLFNATTTPNHRALSDARATVDVLHGLMERLGGRRRAHPRGARRPSPPGCRTAQRRKRHLAEGLPHAPGVYLFRDDRASGCSTSARRKDLRSRVRSYFTASETRSRMGEMVGLAESVTTITCATPLEAEVRELRLIAEHKPKYNRRSRFPEKMHFVKLTREPWPRLSLVRRVLDDDADYLGPFSSKKTAEKCLAALHETFPVRQCSDRIARDPSRTPVRAGRDGPLPVPVRRQRRPGDVRRGGPAAARHPAPPTRRRRRRHPAADDVARRPRSVRGGRASTATGWPPSCAPRRAPSGSPP